MKADADHRALQTQRPVHLTPRNRPWWRGWVLAGLAVTSGCSRSAEPLVCTELAAGDLVITEIRGAQSGVDSRGQWIELYNASEHAIDLLGAQLELARLDGSSRGPVYIRTSIRVDAGDYVVLGHHNLETVPSFVDYSFFIDWYTSSDGLVLVLQDGTIVDNLGSDVQTADLYSTGSVTVTSCGETIDRFVYRQALPSEGSLAFDGAATPSAEANDAIDQWCNDRTPAPLDGPQLDLGIPGTPGEENLVCP